LKEDEEEENDGKWKNKIIKEKSNHFSMDDFVESS